MRKIRESLANRLKNKVELIKHNQDLDSVLQKQILTMFKVIALSDCDNITNGKSGQACRRCLALNQIDSFLDTI